jgi:deazaflavin-dependent oxidoreductase (nitroreductase family)
VERSYIHWVPGVRLMKWISRIHVWLFRVTGGLIGARADGLDMLLLTAIGRRSGLPRTQPLPYFENAAGYLLVASFGGGDSHPAWFYNLVAQPEVEIQVRRRRLRGLARSAEGPERERLWAAITAEHPRYLEYQEKTSRQIPVVVVEAKEPVPA